MKLIDGKEVVVHCKLILDENEDIIYKFFCEPAVECKSKSSVKAVKQIFNLL